MNPPGDTLAGLRAALRRDQGDFQPIVTFGCLPFTPERDFTRTALESPLRRTSDGAPAKGPCPICLRATEPPAASTEPDYLVCGACVRGSPRFERMVRAQAHRDQQRQHLIQHNRQLTAGTPVPPVLLDAEPPEPAPRPSLLRGRTLAERYGLVMTQSSGRTQHHVTS